MNLFVSNLHFDTTELDLRREFNRYATVTRCHIVRDRETGRSKGYAFVEVNSRTEGMTCIYELSGAELDGRALSVQIAQDRPASDGPAAHRRRWG